MHRSMFYVLSNLVTALYVCIFMFMGLDSRMIWCLVASSCPIRGLGMLQCGIRAHIGTWASMGHQEVVTEVGYPLPNRGKM